LKLTTLIKNSYLIYCFCSLCILLACKNEKCELLYSSPSESVDYNIIVLAGQSNMVGRGDVCDLEYPNLPNSISFINRGKSPVRFSAKNRTNKYNFGPEVGLAQSLQKYAKGDILLFKYAIGGTSIRNWLESPGYLDSLLMSLEEIKYFGTIKYFVWVQGESDANQKYLDIEQYYQDVKHLFSQVTITSETDLLRISLLKSNPGNISSKNVEKVQFVQERIAKESNHISLLESDGLSKHADDLHYNTNGQLELGKRIAEHILNAKVLNAI